MILSINHSVNCLNKEICKPFNNVLAFADRLPIFLLTQQLTHRISMTILESCTNNSTVVFAGQLIIGISSLCLGYKAQKKYKISNLFKVNLKNSAKNNHYGSSNRQRKLATKANKYGVRINLHRTTIAKY